MDNGADTTQEYKKVKKGKKESELRSLSLNHKKKSFESVSPVREFEAWWKAEYQRRFGKEYLFSFGKEGRLIKTMLKTCNENLDALKVIAANFLDSTDAFTQQAGHTIGVLYTRFNALNGRRNPDTVGTNDAKPKPFEPTATQKILMEMEP